MSTLSSLSKLSQIKLPSGTTYAIIDADGRAMIAPKYATGTAYDVNDYVIYNDDLYRVTAAITSTANTSWSDITKSAATIGGELKSIKTSLTTGIHYRGYTTTALTDGATTNPITINGNSYTAVAGDLVIYTSGNDGLEFLFDGTTWNEFGSTGTLRAMAFADTASGTGSVNVTGSTSGVAVSMTLGSGNTTSITPFASGGSFTQGNDSFTQGSDSFVQGSDSFSAGSYTVSSEVLTITLPTFTQGTDTFTQGSDSFTQGSDTFVAATGGTAVDAVTSLPTPSVTQGTVSASGSVTVTVSPDAIS